MSYSEEQLYYACIIFCEAFFKLLCEKDKMRSEWCPDEEKDVRLRFANERLNSAYERLFKAIEDWENDGKGVFGQNKYKLKLEKSEEQQNQQIKEIFDKRIEQLEHDLQASVKAGMPTSALYGEIELLEELKEEIIQKLDTIGD